MKRLKTFSLYKESYLLPEYEDETTPSMDEQPTEDAPVDDMPSDEPSELPEGGEGEGELDGEEEESELTIKIRGIIEGTYADQLEDLIHGIASELGEDEDLAPEDVHDSIMDVLEEKIASILMPEEGEGDDTEEGEGEEGEGEEMPEEGEGEEASEEEEEMPEEEEEMEFEEEEEVVADDETAEEEEELEEEEEEEVPVTESRKVLRRK